MHGPLWHGRAGHLATAHPRPPLDPGAADTPTLGAWTSVPGGSNRLVFGSLYCGMVGCRWENRRGYDWCPRCQAVSWHVVHGPRRRRTLQTSVLAVAALPAALLSWAGAHEGSDLFADEIA